MSVTATRPQITVLAVHFDHHKTYWLYFIDSSIADRVAKAMTHAVELCGGGNKEPF